MLSLTVDIQWVLVNGTHNSAMGSFEACFRSMIWLTTNDSDHDMGILCHYKYADNEKQEEFWMYYLPESGFRTSEQTAKWAKSNQMKCNNAKCQFYSYVLKSLYAFRTGEVWLIGGQVQRT